MLNKNKYNIETREKIIAYIYLYELFSKKLDNINATKIKGYTQQEIKIINNITKAYDLLKKIILIYTKKTWLWERIAPLSRAILVYGAFELSFSDKALVNDILVRYSQKFIPDETYKFINSILDNIGDYYETIKRNKK